MRRIALLYASEHHQNTERVVQYLAAHFGEEMDVIDLVRESSPDIAAAEWVILASGIYFGTVHKALTEFIGAAELRGKKALLIYTCGLKYRDYAKATGKLLARRGAFYMGSCHCRGWDSYGPLQKLGGIAKKHPDRVDFERILRGVNCLMERRTNV